jgi:hypothetical protein
MRSGDADAGTGLVQTAWPEGTDAGSVCVRIILLFKCSPVSRSFQTRVSLANRGSFRGVHDEFPGHGVERPHHRHFAPLAGSGDTQIGASFDPGMGEIRMGQGLGLIGIQQHDIAHPGLLAAQSKTRPDTVDLVRVLPPFQRVTRTAPAEPLFS